MPKYKMIPLVGHDYDDKEIIIESNSAANAEKKFRSKTGFNGPLMIGEIQDEK